MALMAGWKSALRSREEPFLLIGACSSPNVTGSLLGATSHDHLGSTDYSGYLGELILMPSEPGIPAARYSVDPVAFYVTGGLKHAACLLETYFDAAQSAGVLGSASLQAGVWGVLYD